MKRQAGPTDYATWTEKPTRAERERAYKHRPEVAARRRELRRARYVKTRLPFPERFWARVDRSGGPAACWPWMGYRNQKGYGVCTSRNVKSSAPRFGWELTFGPIPSGLHVLHNCDNPPCVNPSHLKLGTNADNVRDKMLRGRVYRAPKGTGGQPGSAHPRAKLTETDIPVIRKRLASGELQRLVALDYGVTPATINGINVGRTWTHVEVA